MAFAGHRSSGGSNMGGKGTVRLERPPSINTVSSNRSNTGVVASNAPSSSVPPAGRPKSSSSSPSFSRRNSTGSPRNGKTSSNFQRELQVPGIATAIVIGKSGRTIGSFQNTPGISSVRISSGKVEIRGHSEKASVTCFCKSLTKPLQSVSEICFEKFSGETSSYHRDQASKSYFCFKSGARWEQGSSTPESDGLRKFKSEISDDMDSLFSEFTGKSDEDD